MWLPALCVIETSGVQAQEVRFSNPPSDQEIIYSGLLPEPLVPVGGQTTPNENRALADALLTYSRATNLDQVEPISSFVQSNPQSPWDTALLINLGKIYQKTGHFSRVARVWEAAWNRSRDLTDPADKALADDAVGKLALFYAYLGKVEQLDALMTSLSGRSLTGAATEHMADAAKGLAMMHKEPQISFRCGPLALESISLLLKNPAAKQFFSQMPSTSRGTSLVQLKQWSEQVGLNYQMAFRKTGADIIVPSVVHWKTGHFAAILGRVGDGYSVGDSTFGENICVRSSTLDEETSGFFLVPGGSLPAGWSSVTEADGANIWGRGNTGSGTGPGPGPGDPPGFPAGGGCDGGSPGGDSGGGGGGSPEGMTTYNVDAMPNSLELHDVLLSYSPPVGPHISFELYYMHRDDQQPHSFTYTNFGPKWTSNWISYIIDHSSDSPPTADQYLPGGGLESYAYTPQGTLAPGMKTQAQVTQLIVGGNLVGFQSLLPDGSIQKFQQRGSVARQFLLTSVSDPQGNTVHVHYDSTLRITAITDAIGQTTTLSYGLPNHPLKVTSVTDPFGRTATLTYAPDQAGVLHVGSITDAIRITSSFTYGQHDFITKLTTPYGTTTFAGGEGFVSGSCGSVFHRFLDITDPLGFTSRVEYAQCAPGIDPYGPPAAMPYNAGMLGAMDEGFLQWRNTFVWDPHQLALARRSNGTLDYTKARIMHFLHGTLGGPNQDKAVPVLDSIKEPLENRVCYNYPGEYWPGPQTALYMGSSNQPVKIARALDWLDHTTQLTTISRNSLGRLTSFTDPAGRAFDYSYAPNGIDQVSGNIHLGPTLFSASYNSHHRPLTITDAAGQTSTFTYNAAGQVLTSTNPLGQETHYTYDSRGFLTRIQWPSGERTVSLTYDAFNRIQTITNELGYTVSLSYDSANRLTRIEYPDHTARTYTYSLLDMASATDRLGRTTTFQYDAKRRLKSITDPLGRTTRLGYCDCGKLSEVTDPGGNRTTFTYDLEERLIGRDYPNGSHVAYTYDPVSNGGFNSGGGISRITTMTDANGQVTDYVYNPDNTLSSISSGNTPIVNFTYDSVFRHILSMTDSTGTTNYTYNPPGVLGAMFRATELGPFGDLISYHYDGLSRRVRTVVNGVASTQRFDPLGRMTSEENALGTFDYRYLGGTEQISARSGDGPSEEVSSFDAHSAYLPGQIAWNTSTAGPTPTPTSTPYSSFSYSYNAEGQVTTLGLNLPPELPVLYQVNYDLDGELINLHANISPSILDYAYTYSPTFNILSAQAGANTTPFSYNNLNQLTRIGASVPNESFLSYDASGNLQMVSNVLHLPITTYDWVSNTSRPIQLTVPDYQLAQVNYQSSNTNSKFKYDGYGRRTEIIETDSSGHKTSDKRYVWDGARLSEEHDMLAGGALTKRYFSQGVQLIPGGRYYYTLDRLGTVYQLVDSSGSVRAQYSYDPYGNRVQTNGHASSDIGYTGLFHHQPSGLALAMFRVYSPEMRRWLSRDPLGEFANSGGYAFSDPLGEFAKFQVYDLKIGRWLSPNPLDLAKLRQGPNLYTYVGNNPVNWIDLSGMYVCQSELSDLNDKLVETVLACGAAAETGFESIIADVGCAYLGYEAYKVKKKFDDCIAGKNCPEGPPGPDFNP
jgi:RHS repeat-associated protein